MKDLEDVREVIYGRSNEDGYDTIFDYLETGNLEKKAIDVLKIIASDIGSIDGNLVVGTYYELLLQVVIDAKEERDLKRFAQILDNAKENIEGELNA